MTEKTEKTEKIGRVTIDRSYYPGEDLYCDGAVEDELLQIVQEASPAGYAKIIEERKSWPILYHLSALRENIVSWLPFKKTDKVLEVGSGCGAVTGALARGAGSVTCIELSRKRSLINAYRNRECGNVTIRLGNFETIEPSLPCDYDYIFLIGVFEYGQSYIGGTDPFGRFLTILRRHLAEHGRLVIAIENRFGLKYWAGCQEDHLGAYFDGIENYPRGGGVRTFTKKELERLCAQNAVTDFSFYYPYPDYKFMSCLYSDARLPKLGELSDNMRNFDRERLLLFDEKQAFDSLIQEGLFPEFSNSYLLVVGEALPVVYSKYSNDRAPQYAIRTEIRRGEEGLFVRKVPLTRQAEAHVERLQESCRQMEEAYAGSGLLINHCRLDGKEAVFDFLEGRTLEETLDERLVLGDTAGFEALFERFCALAAYPRHAPVYDYDFIFSNIIVEKDVWHLIDYEWVFPKGEGAFKGRGDFAVPSAEELCARALYCYGLGSEQRKRQSLSLLRERFGYGDALLETLAENERAFQKYSTGERLSMVEIRNAIDQAIIPAAALAYRYLEARRHNRIQIYEDNGNGFSEETSYFLPVGDREGKPVTVKIEAKAGRRALRLDPAMEPCIVRFVTLQNEKRSLSLHDKNIKLNGKLISKDTAAFATQDPGVTFLNMDGGLYAELEITRISMETAESIAGKAGERKGPHRGKLWFPR